jgi:hypothetical protein
MVRGFFGPRSMRPRGHRIRQRTRPPTRENNTFRGAREHMRNMPHNGHGNTSESSMDCAASSIVYTVPTMNPFPIFDP